MSWGLGHQVDGESSGIGGPGGSVGFASTRHGYAVGYVTRLTSDGRQAGTLGACVNDCLT